MKDHASVFADAPDFGYRLDHSDFVVRQHHRDQNGLVSDCVFYVVRRDQAVGAHWQICDIETVLLQRFAAIQYGLVFGDDGYYVIAALAVRVGHALDREIVRLGDPRGEYYLLGRGSDQAGHLLSRGFNRFLGLPAKAMAPACCIAEKIGEVGSHSLKDARITWRRGVVIHIDGKLNRHKDSV